LNISLIIGAVSERIEVTSEAPLLNAENANIASDISARQVSELPLNLRNVIGLAVLNSSVSNAAELQIVGAPGISGSADQDVSFLNFGGTFFNTVEYLLDGTWYTRLDWGGVIYVPSVDMNRHGHFEKGDPGSSAPVVGRGAAFGDLNNDGWIDVVATSLGDRPQFFLNRGGSAHWLTPTCMAQKAIAMAMALVS
jgi:hypothetical protein